MGPLNGFRIIELAGIGPGPFAAMVLADLGAEVVRVDRAEWVGRPARRPQDPLLRGRRSLGVNLKSPEGAATILRLVESADGLIEGFRPGVAERLGVGPDECLARNPRLVYGRMTGWGQDGPIASAAGHDINYISLAGMLHAIGHEGDKPVPPLNLIGDFGGGGMLLALGVVCALLERERSGQGQVVDAAMVDGAALLGAAIFGMLASGMWSDERGKNLLDSGAPFYDVYETADGRYISIGSLEPQFYAELLSRTGLDDGSLPAQMDRAGWPQIRARLVEVFKQKTRDEWCDVMEGSDVCFSPVLSLAEAPRHPHNEKRGTFIEVDGVVQPGPAPRFSRTRGEVTSPPATPGQHTREILADWGFPAADVDRLMEAGAIA